MPPDADPMLAPADPLPASVSGAMAIVGDRWSLAVIAALLDGPLRYGELQARLESIAPNILSARLRKLADEGIVIAVPYSRRPPRVEYRLSGDGQELSDLLHALAAWGARIGGSAHGAVHAVCGTPLEMRWWCPACAELATPAAEADARV